MIKKMKIDLVEKMYHAILGEGYYAIPHYQDNFKLIQGRLNEELV